MTPFILMIALSMHAMFEGIALGLMNNTSSVINLIVSILIHKCAEAMSISFALQKTFYNFGTLAKFIFLFSLATPIGTSIGLLLGNAPPLVSVIFTSLAGGTFIYVSCSELIVEEFSLPGNRWLKLLAFVLGAVLISLLLLFDS